jgi:hypothetical protein
MQVLGISSVQILGRCKKCSAVKILQVEKKEFSSYFMVSVLTASNLELTAHKVVIVNMIQPGNHV